MEFHFNKFSFWGIQDLCRIHYREILQRKNLKSVIDGRKVRFIDPLGEFCYADFGDFYNGSMGTMMLVTREKKYAQFHEPDELSNTLWSTIPVFYAGVETKFRDENNNMIFTGDVVTYKGWTSMVRFFGDYTRPGLAGDNCEILFEDLEPIHKIGTVFSDIPISLPRGYDYNFFQWPLERFVPQGISIDEMIARAQKSYKKPHFADELPKLKRWKRNVYENIAETLTQDDILVYFIGDEVEDEEYGVYNEILADYIPESFKGKELTLHLPEDKWQLKSWKKLINDFLLTAHFNPDKRYVFCDFRKQLGITKRIEHAFAMTFYDWYEYNIPNVALPLWIFICHMGHDCIGRD